MNRQCPATWGWSWPLGARPDHPIIVANVRPCRLLAGLVQQWREQSPMLVDLSHTFEDGMPGFV
jgi:hypothetical protein